MPDFSDYIVFADESGSPVLDGIDPTFPVFVLACVLVRKDVYAERVVPDLQRLKFDFAGHDQLILHERDIRRQQKAFAFLQVDAEVRRRFIDRMNQIVADAEIEIVAAVIDKRRLRAAYADPWSPYEIALHFCMEMLLTRMLEQRQAQKLLHVVFEGRGAKEDRELELHFRRVAGNERHWGYRRSDFSVLRWEPLVVSKQSNSSGLQLADLVARPLGLKVLRPLQENRAFDVIRPKLVANGLKSFP